MQKSFAKILRGDNCLGILLIIGLTLSCLFYSCKTSPQKLMIMYDQELEHVKDLAKQDDKMFCVVLFKPNCSPCSDFIQSLGDRYGHLASKVIFNVVDVSRPENQWYLHWLCTSAFLTTCIFSTSGELLAAVPCSAESCWQCIESAIIGDTKCAGYFENPQFPIRGKRSLVMLNTLLSCKQKLNQDQDISDEIQPLLDSHIYPYSLFLMCLNEKKQGRYKEATYWAQRMIAIESPYYSFVYDTLYKEAKSTINSNYAVEASELSVVEELKLEDCKYKEAKPFSLTLTNTGKSTLHIRDITMSCSCLELLGEKQQTIQPGASLKMDFIFTSDVRGDVFRAITFFSDAKNSMQNVRIFAIVK